MCFSVSNQSLEINCNFIALKVDASASAAYKTAHPDEKYVRRVFARNFTKSY
ncbi:hypothetical protein IMCC14465_07780 [alpha proteobacterium IMCC14465]|uniref:Uncharacterized protein n=1 Tax=alpha proteobacterium IMCC14465 TaxID=1220535 RepID=J9DVD4_9PROT|nr:hypothetical protein IMCC14465_07780 [alpha proteobacterium IMCC14465]